MSGSQPSKPALAARVWRIMFDVLVRSSGERNRILVAHGLTPNDSRALFSLDARDGNTMRALADAWECDPSNATWVVDRLEKLGLAERQSVSHDRRVKLVVLTAKGQKTRTELLKEFHRPPAEVTALDREDLEDLHRVLLKLSPASAPAQAVMAPRVSAPRQRGAR
jgi:DNA-binding MarR family transcriptional regulator